MSSQSEPITTTQSFYPSLFQSFLIIFISEIADRTFILVVIYSLKLPWIPLILVSFLSNAMMNFLAIGIGYLVPVIFMRNIVNWIGFFCFLAFGFYSFHEARIMDNDTVYEEVQEELEKEDKTNERKDKSIVGHCIELFCLLAISEMGDRSQIATIAITALYNVLGVIFGTLIAYLLAIILAASIGKMLGKIMTEKQMTYIGGGIFIIFAFQILFEQIGIL